MIVLGINAYHANASAALVIDGQLVAAVEEERLNRVKYAAGLPARAVEYCLQSAGVKLSDVDHIALPRNPWARLGTKLRFAMRMPRFAIERAKVASRFGGIQEELASNLEIDPTTIRAQTHRIEHHRAHIASAFFVSPFERAAVLSADGLGDFASTMWGAGEGSNLRIDGATAFPHSLGMFYTAMTQFLGFHKFGEEYKVMGLAAYGSPAFGDFFCDIVAPEKPLGVRLNLRYFTHHKSGPEMTWNASDQTPVLGRLFSSQLEEQFGPPREPASPIENRHKDFAASMQARLEEVLLANVNALYEQTKLKTLCLAGGVAFNCLANGKLLEQTPFEQIYVQPAAGDGGLSIGAAFAVYHQVLGKPRSFQMNHVFWGPSFSTSEIREALTNSRQYLDLRIRELEEDALVRATATHIAQGKIVGWLQGRAEWGPRALGNRSILADPRRPEMKETLNRRIKHREEFRPFAPSVLEESVGEYFEQTHPSPFMTFAYKVRASKRGAIPAPTHVDGTGRLQTVDRESHPLYWKLLRAFGDVTGIPVLLNTSFNDNEPIVCHPREALACFERTRMDVLVLGNFILEKSSAETSEEKTSAEVLGSRP